MIDSSKYCSQLEQLKVVLSGNHPSVNRKCIIFNQDNAKTTRFFDDQAKTVTAWVGSSDSSTICTRHCTYFGLYKILLLENISISWKTVKGIWNSFLPQKVQSFRRWNYEVVWKVAEDSGTKWWIHCSRKFLVKMKNVSFT